jgi:predicted Zn finger-like uncharacterized protein
MQVQCPQCDAVYNFDKTVIPPEGYDAQCTNCPGVFFVKPPPEEAADPVLAQDAPADLDITAPVSVPEQSAEISVGCPGCAAVYRFPSDSIPAEGYDAQCTQCQEVFFVAGATSLVTQTTPGIVAEDSSISLADAVRGSAESTETTDNEPFPEPDPTLALYGEPANQVDDLLQFGDSLGDMGSTMNDLPISEDFELMLERKKKRTIKVVGVLVGVPLFVALMYGLAPGIFDATIGPLIGVKARIHPDAIPYVEQGYQRLREDTTEAYDDAITKFEKALELDRDYPAALALVSLAYMFRGADLQAEGSAIRAKAEGMIGEITGLQKKNGRSRARGARIQKLRNQVKEMSGEASGIYEEGAKKFEKAHAYTTEAINKFKMAPLVVATSGMIMFERDPDKKDVTLKRLKIGRRYLSKTKDNAAMNTALIGMFDARVLQRTKTDSDKAIKGLRKVLINTPDLQRARYMLACLLRDSGKKEEAQAMAKEILTDVSSHKGAQALLEAGADGKNG